MKLHRGCVNETRRGLRRASHEEEVYRHSLIDLEPVIGEVEVGAMTSGETDCASCNEHSEIIA